MLCDADIILTLHGALNRGKTPCDLTFRLARRNGALSSSVTATADTYNSAVHEGTLETLDNADIALDLKINADPWVPGGRARFRIRTAGDGTALNGSYAGTFNDSERRGSVAGTAEPPWKPLTDICPGTPAILEELLADPSSARLPDCSYAGYHHGECAPAVGDSPVFRVEEFGAHPNCGKDATQPVQRAIDTALEAGGGIVLFPPGRFEFGLQHPKRCLEIHGSNVVLRGAGSGPEGTMLFAHTPGRSPDPKAIWRANEYPRIIHVGHCPAPDMGGYGPLPGSKKAALCPARRGDTTIEAVGTADIHAGQTLLLIQTEDEEGTLGKSLTAPAHRLEANYLGAGKALVKSCVTIDRVDANRLYLTAPLRWELRPEWHPALYEIPMITEVGIEHLRLASAWDEYFVHHKSDVHDNGWDLVRIDGLVDGWVRNIVFDSCTTALSLKGSARCTVSDCRISGNPGHNGFSMGGATSNCLFLNLFTDRAFHALNLSGTICGNAIVDCESAEPGGLDLHGGTGTDNLIDCLRGCVYAGGGSPTAVPPRHGRGLVLWNWQTGSQHPYKPWRTRRFMAELTEVPGLVAVGVRSRSGAQIHYRIDGEQRKEDRDSELAVIESVNRAVEPRSLWRWQLVRRRGAVPE